MRNIADTFVENIKIHILCSITFFFENLVIYEIMRKNMDSRTVHRWQYNTMHALWVPDN